MYNLAYYGRGFIKNLKSAEYQTGTQNGNMQGSNIVSTQKIGEGKYEAENQICLLPGFEATAKDKFLAEIKTINTQYQWQYALSDHLGNLRVIFTDKNNDGLIRQSLDDNQNEVLSFRNYSPFGLELGGSHKNLDYQNGYKFGGKELDNFTSYSDFGGRWLDMNLSKWTTFDPLGEKFYPSTLNSYAVNSPIMLNDPSGKDWSISASRDKNGNWQINITVNAAVLNSSSNHFDMRNYIANQKANFARIFSKSGDGFEVKATLNLRPVIDKSQVKESEHLVHIQNPDKFDKIKNGFEGGFSTVGGLLVNINSKGINPDGTVNSNATLSHELGHTGGLKHPFDNTQSGYFANGEKVDFGNQIDNTNDTKLYNFMSYPQNFYSLMKSDYNSVINNIYQNPGGATRNQISLIMKMYYSKNLNTNDK